MVISWLLGSLYHGYYLRWDAAPNYSGTPIKLHASEAAEMRSGRKDKKGALLPTPFLCWLYRSESHAFYPLVISHKWLDLNGDLMGFNEIYWDLWCFWPFGYVKMAIEIVDIPMKNMVDLSIVMVIRLPEDKGILGTKQYDLEP